MQEIIEQGLDSMGYIQCVHGFMPISLCGKLFFCMKWECTLGGEASYI